jgi:hypothetical protein
MDEEGSLVSDHDDQGHIEKTQGIDFSTKGRDKPLSGLMGKGMYNVILMTSSALRGS